MLPATAAARGPYVDVLFAAGGGAFVGEATAFISHAYAYPFLTVVDAVAAWEARHWQGVGQPAKAPFYYFDLFVVNQHGQTMGVPPEVLWAEFCGAVVRIQRTLLVCAWRSAILPFTRAWCLAEIATALGGGDGEKGAGAFSLVMPPEEEAAFLAALQHGFDDLVRKSCTIDLAAAQAYHTDGCMVKGVCRHVASTGADRISQCPNDGAFVRRAVRDGIGFEAANERVAAAMRNWMEAAGRAALESLPEGERPGSDLASGYARLLCQLGRLEDAERLFRGALAARVAALGERHPRSLAAKYDLGFHLSWQARLLPAEALLREALEGQAGAPGFGAAHPEALDTALALARNLHDQRRFEEADELFARVVAGRRGALGREHPDTLEALRHRGVLLEKWGRLAEAGDCLREALEGLTRALGPLHPTSLSAMHKFATLLVAQGRAGDAAPLYRAALAGRRRALGSAHPNTLWSMAKVAGVEAREGRLREAEALRREAREGFVKAFGEAHPAALDALAAWEAAKAALEEGIGGAEALTGGLADRVE